MDGHTQSEYALMPDPQSCDGCGTNPGMNYPDLVTGAVSTELFVKQAGTGAGNGSVMVGDAMQDEASPDSSHSLRVPNRRFH